ncbi:hypothetical protein PVAP13_8KG240500 [Panicum virgatum]|uniref:Protein kinase domain-containing protein n=2 Tax=Panicum virgatum TaxID=38727 RepID=A0A8T0PP62_PANVG|nr:hypothetical protein PVAP13_8KG240500 [Panicum virgatum]
MQGKDRSRWIAHSNRNTKRFTKREIERITNNYKTILGRGAFGEVYRGDLDKNIVVAVKRLVCNLKENFDQELNVHREVNHKNIVRLIGYCAEENALMIVTEYIPNGNLNDILHRASCIPTISLETRLRIATECAEALTYMHSYMYTQVIHGDIKPANILIDGRLKAKVSYFGISRLVNDPDKTLFTENFIGSIGYMDPLFARDGRLTVKSDVYSFGVVLVELITRKRAATSDGETNIVDAFTNALANGARGVGELFDAEIASQNNVKILDGVAKLAGECLLMERGRRPEMIDVVERLRTLWKASHQVRQQQWVDLFSWARKNRPTAPALVTTTSPPGLCRRFSLEEMKVATRNFDELLVVNPNDTICSVYCGGIDGGATRVAIMRPNYRHDDGGYDFRSAIKMRSELNHGHIVPLIGYCEEDSETILVYDFMACGSLHCHLYENQQEPQLTWKERLGICIGAARGLHYLHRGTDHTIVHGSLNSTNILLDENLVAKIIDGGLSDNASGQWVLSSNFLEENPHDLTKESDVLDFGVLLFEVLSGKPGRVLPRGDILKRVSDYKREGKLDQFFDPALKEEINLQSLNKFVKTAARCVADHSIDRPSMVDVLWDLEYALQLQVNVC